MPPSFDALIHAVLDGEATAAERAELDRRMDADPALRAQFEAVQRVFTMLEAVPAVDPPVGLVDSILARVSLRAPRLKIPHQPFARANVIAAYPDSAKAKPSGRAAAGNWFSALVHFLKEIGMNDSKPGLLGTNRGKLLVTAGVAAVALIGISSVIDFPIGGTTTTVVVPNTQVGETTTTVGGTTTTALVVSPATLSPTGSPNTTIAVAAGALPVTGSQPQGLVAAAIAALIGGGFLVRASRERNAS